MSERPPSNYAPERVRGNFRLDLTSALFGALMFGFVVPFMPIIVRRLGGTTLEVSLVVASAFIGHLLSPIGSYALSRFPIVASVAVTSQLARIAFIVGALAAPSPLFLAVAIVAFWILNLANLAAYTALMQTMYPPEQRATAMGRVRIAANLTALLASLGGGAILQVAGDPVHVLAAAAIVSMIGNVIFMQIRLDDTAARARIVSPLSLLPMVRADPTYARYLVALSIFGFGNLIAATLYPLLMVDAFDAPNAFVGVYGAAGAAATMLGYHVFGSRIDRGSSIRLSLANSVFVLGMPLVYLAAPNAWFLLPAAVLGGLAMGGGDLTFYTNMVQLAPPGKAADYMAAQSFALGLRGTIAPFVASGLLLVLDARVVLVTVVVLIATGLALMRDVAQRVDARDAVVRMRPA